PLRIQGGVLSGANTIWGSVTNSGVVNPGASGSSIGKLTITSNYVQTATGVLNIELAGANPAATFDVLSVVGTTILAGTLNVTLANGFNPSADDTFVFLTANSRTGVFNGLVPSNVGLSVNYNPTSAWLQFAGLQVPVLRFPIYPNGHFQAMVTGPS